MSTNTDSNARPATRAASLQAFGRRTRCAASLLAWVWAICALSFAGCGGAKQETATAATPPGEKAAAAPAVETQLHRAALDEFLAKGPAYALALVQSDAVKEGGRFVGFRIVSFREEPPAYLGLRAGDVVARVNGLPIETPDQFFAVFEALKTASEVRFDVVRDGAPETVAVPVVP
jgi:type II secretory pathway component PulC